MVVMRLIPTSPANCDSKACWAVVALANEGGSLYLKGRLDGSDVALVVLVGLPLNGLHQ